MNHSNCPSSVEENKQTPFLLCAVRRCFWICVNYLTPSQTAPPSLQHLRGGCLIISIIPAGWDADLGSVCRAIPSTLQALLPVQVVPGGAGPREQPGAHRPQEMQFPLAGWADGGLPVSWRPKQLGRGFCFLHLVKFFCFSFTDLVWNWKLAFLGLGLHWTFYSYTFFKRNY